MNIARILLRLILAVVKLAKNHKLKGRECEELFSLIDDACELTHQNDCQLDGAIDDAQRLANELELSQDDLGRKIKTMELNEEEFWKERVSLNGLIDKALERVDELGKLDEHRDCYKAVGILTQTMKVIQGSYPPEQSGELTNLSDILDDQEVEF